MNNPTKMLLSFLAGAAAGAVIVYLATSPKSGDPIQEFRDMADKLKSDLTERLGKRRPGTGPSPAEGPDNPEDYMGV